jgi:aldehyde:ferredoxin oxidoreductase
MKTIQSMSYKPEPINGGYTDRILRLDVSSYAVSIQELPPEFKEKYIGGRGYALKLIWDETTKDTRYDSPENVLVMAGGPLCCEPRFPGAGKFIIGTISPLTDTFIDSNIGGHFSSLLKLCGFDALAISGISEKEVVLIVDGDKGTIEIAEAPSYGEAVDGGALSYGEALMREFNGGGFDEDVALVTTGIGALHARFGIVNSLFYDKRRERVRSKQAGRGGTGTVMRRKGVRAVIVRSSSERIGANHPIDDAGVKQAGSSLKKVVSQMDRQQLRLSSLGTPVLIEYMDKYHLLPVNNYQYGSHPDAKAIFADVFLKSYFEKKLPDGCYFGCNLACAKSGENVTLQHGSRAGARVGVDGPEYETAGAVTCMGIFDPQFIMEFNWYCDEYGLDTISMGVSASFLMECAQRGYLTKEDTGYELKWGDVEAVHRLIEETAFGRGIGRVCGDGVHRAKKWVAERHAARTGEPIEAIWDELEKFAMETEGLEFSMYISKESLAQQGGYGFALKGPQHDEAWLIFIDQVHKELPTFEAKAQALKWFPMIRTWFNAVGLCKLPWIDVRHPEAAKTDKPAQNQPTLAYYVQYLNATVGSKKSLEDVLKDSERLYLLQKLINLRNGKGTRKSDRIPLRAMGPAFLNEYESRAEYYSDWLKERLNGAELPAAAKERHDLLIKFRREAFEKLCDMVYKEKGFTPDAIPLPETIAKFGLLDEKAKSLLASYTSLRSRLN